MFGKYFSFVYFIEMVYFLSVNLFSKNDKRNDHCLGQDHGGVWIYDDISAISLNLSEDQLSTVF